MEELYFGYVLKINTRFADRLDISVGRTEKGMTPTAKWSCHTEMRTEENRCAANQNICNCSFCDFETFLTFHTSHNLNVSVFHPTFNITRNYFCFH